MNTEIQCNIITYTKSGFELAKVIKEGFSTHREIILFDKQAISKAGGLNAVMQMLFLKHKEVPQVIVCICAVGIAVRGIAPCVKDKFEDPPVLVVDDMGQFVIPILSGHIGGANAISKQVSKQLQKKGYAATHVLTTATDHRGMQGFESLLSQLHIPIKQYRQEIKRLNMAIAEGHQVGVWLDPNIRSDVKFPESVTLYNSLKDLFGHTGEKLCVTISSKIGQQANKKATVMHARCVVVGTGCKKYTDPLLYKRMLHEALDEADIADQSVCAFVSLALKEKEACILSAAKDLESVFEVFNVQELEPYEQGFEGSDFVKGVTGIKAVAGPSALKATGDLWAQKVIKKKGCTFAFGRKSI